MNTVVRFALLSVSFLGLSTAAALAQTATPAPAAPAAPIVVPDPLPGAMDIMMSAPPMAGGMMAPKAETAMEPGTHEIVAGDTLWDIAKKSYGDATMWKKIAEANPDAKARRLAIGGKLVIPAK